MESQTTVNEESRNLSPCSSGRRSSASSHASSPEFEFWMVRNPAFPQPDLISADKLFINGFLRPLHLLNNKQPEESPKTEKKPPASEPSVPDPEPEPSPFVTSDPTPALSPSKRWKDIFKKEKGKIGSKNQQDKDKEKEKKKEKKSQSQRGGSPAELNINLWPFSRSRSAGTSGTRPRMTASSAGARKVSSAPCSRSNSAGESKSRKWPSSPSRAGVHLGRSSPVWQVRRSGSAVKSFDALIRTADKGSGKKEVTETRRDKTGNGSINNNKAKVLNVNVPMCIRYKHHLNCRIDDNTAAVAGISTHRSGGSDGNGRSSGPNVGSGNNFFNLRNLFTKKVY
ncbi:plastid-lipid-associated protein [Hibiscus syriacus]|uniref:Plastid-lipid-associated protein n=1 Tax=Hibiscus syriacus TaxID=106335 RepID=A0A6A3DAU3_HIBSY|nr:uncharacterized protein LOC120130911 [Hibiscus syriacus]KAE8736219.1 plastid-lipid-associated protein [Hibiscus syriacus]